jgi:hypothetical protein
MGCLLFLRFIMGMGGGGVSGETQVYRTYWGDCIGLKNRGLNSLYDVLC